MRGNGIPHNVTSMSAKCRCPDVWFKIALEYLTANTDWLEIEEVTTERHPGVSPTSAGRQSPDEEGKEGEKGKNGMEGNGSDGSVERMLRVKTAIGKLYGFGPDARWPYDEEFGLVEACRNVNVEAELAEILAYHGRMPDKGFFPRSPASLFSKWTATLYSARLGASSKIPVGDKEFTPDEIIAKEKRLQEIYRKARSV